MAKVRYLRLGAASALLLLLVSSCYYLQAPDVPMPARYYAKSNGYQGDDQPPAKHQRDLIIMLPGMGDRIDRFAKEGLIDQLASADIPVDAVVVNAHFAYYRSRSFLQRLQQDVLQRAAQAGYQRVHLAGVSLGGFGSLLYWRHNLDNPTPGLPIASALLLTPYVGEPEYYAHRVNLEQPPRLVMEEKNIWPWLDQLSRAQSQHWYIGIAEQDAFYQGNQTFAQQLPKDHIFVTEGGHNWNSWRALWPQLLAQFKRDYFQSQEDESL
ncbi:hypothetical protein QWI17_02445 [Gilvimarinus sp. SDUM040013]|uniref:Esterase n=1 Tax=Gilvimarinus gilvus TaxID=3058038 RepID=A0ABU4S4L0_9GAMM|nr:hypothetical protein [Gilvimarinus sp. SDUM040013]MDO3384692.1 hypothetical protein [Gilvimarinus sp. SDUM040013]MDX6850833.1 hypothetical protein [Gilvimarinus sp. SDUM040013]